jgi:membrane associated rhomboid family serine protease
MGYSPVMAMIVPALAALLAAAATPATAPLAGASMASTRFTGAAAVFSVSARIIRNSARVGAGFGPPRPAMQARATTVTAADGAAVPALVYDFE